MEKVAAEFDPSSLLKYIDDIPMLAAGLSRNAPNQNKNKKAIVDKPVQSSIGGVEKKADSDPLKEFEAQVNKSPETRRAFKKLIKQQIHKYKTRQPEMASRLDSLVKNKDLLNFSAEEKKLTINFIRQVHAVPPAVAVPPVVPKIPKILKSGIPGWLKALGVLTGAGLAGYGGYKLYKYQQKNKEEQLEKKAGPILNYIMAKLKKKEEPKPEDKLSKDRSFALR